MSDNYRASYTETWEPSHQRSTDWPEPSWRDPEEEPLWAEAAREEAAPPAPGFNRWDGAA